jgi:hypothetical protein
MAKRSKEELDGIEQRIFSAKTEQEKKWWKLILERLKNNPPPKPPKAPGSRKS